MVDMEDSKTRRRRKPTEAGETAKKMLEAAMNLDIISFYL